MGIIKLENVRIYAHHGCLKEETIIGSDYIVNLTVSSNLTKASDSDALEDTVDYVLLNAIIKEEMAVPSKLLEHVAKRIINQIFSKDSRADSVVIEVSKINPPIGGDVEKVTILLEENRKS